MACCNYKICLTKVNILQLYINLQVNPKQHYVHLQHVLASCTLF